MTGVSGRDRLLLVGCGVLKKEITLLIRKNGWPMDTLFLDSSLHTDFDELGNGLTGALAAVRDRKTIVFYGSCHPLMDRILAEAGTFRTEGRNCVDMLLGYDVFMEELSRGAFFLTEEWARHWESMMMKTFGTDNREIIRKIFHEDRNCLLCLRTPCTGDFTAEAEAAGRLVDLPLRWMDVTLDHFESVLRTAVARKLREL